MPPPAVSRYRASRYGQATDRATNPLLKHLPPSQDSGIVHNQPDEQAAIKLAIEEFKIPENQRHRRIARRQD
jgi:hypothetical protein